MKSKAFINSKTFLIFLVMIYLSAGFWLSVLPYRHAFKTEVSQASETAGISQVSETMRLPILMYHSVLNRKQGKYVVSEAKLEADFIKLKDEGYEAVFMSEVVDWVDGKGELPAKPIVITFDDGHYNNLHYALPLAKKHKIKFVVFPVTAFSQKSIDEKDTCNANYSYLTFEQIGELAQSGLVEIGSHTHDMHKIKPRYGIAKTTNECDNEYADSFKCDISRSIELIEKSGAPKPISFAYPFGRYSKAGRELLTTLGFRAMLTCNEGVSIIKKGDPKSLYELKRYNRDGHISTNEVFDRIK